jgi:curli biogenesis system outer membrane secretion channel CsgG
MVNTEEHFNTVERERQREIEREREIESGCKNVQLHWLP